MIVLTLKGGYMAKNDRIVKVVSEQGPLGWIFFTAYIGAVIYFFQFDLTVWGFVVALIKAVFWPALVLYEILRNLGV
jgi:hypothetical protein